MRHERHRRRRTRRCSCSFPRICQVCEREIERLEREGMAHVVVVRAGGWIDFYPLGQQEVHEITAVEWS